MNEKDLEDCNQTYINPCPTETDSNQATADRLSGVENRLKIVENQLSLVSYLSFHLDSSGPLQPFLLYMAVICRLETYIGNIFLDWKQKKYTGNKLFRLETLF